MLFGLISLNLALASLDDFFAPLRQFVVVSNLLHFVDELEPVLLLHIGISVCMGDLECPLTQLGVYADSSAGEVRMPQ